MVKRKRVASSEAELLQQQASAAMRSALALERLAAAAEAKRDLVGSAIQVAYTRPQKKVKGRQVDAEGRSWYTGRIVGYVVQYDGSDDPMQVTAEDDTYRLYS